MTIPCQASKEEGVTTIGSSPSTMSIDTALEVHTNFFKNQLAIVDHIDGDKLNNNVNNLRWVTVSQNCFAYGHEKRIENRKRKVKATHKSGKTIIFNSRDDTARYFKCNKSCIDYNKWFVKGNKKDWFFEKVEDIV